MKVNGIVLNSFQANFIKELMGDVFMTDVRAEAQLSHLGAKYGVDVVAMLTAASAPFTKKNEEFKKFEAEELAKL